MLFATYCEYTRRGVFIPGDSAFFALSFSLTQF